MYGKYQTTYEGLFSVGIRIDDLMENGGSNRPKNVLINEWEKWQRFIKETFHERKEETDGLTLAFFF